METRDYGGRHSRDNSEYRLVSAKYRVNTLVISVLILPNINMQGTVADERHL